MYLPDIKPDAQSRDKEGHRSAQSSQSIVTIAQSRNPSGPVQAVRSTETGGAPGVVPKPLSEDEVRAFAVLEASLLIRIFQTIGITAWKY